MILHRAYGTDGRTRAIWSDDRASTLRATGSTPRRASRVEAITEGPHRGLFSVDFTLLSEITGDPRHAVCLARPFERHDAAVAAEVAWLRDNYILELSDG